MVIGNTLAGLSLVVIATVTHIGWLRHVITHITGYWLGWLANIGQYVTE